MGPKSGVDDFFELLKSYNKVIVWTLGAAVAPIAAGMAKLAPPWPPSIIQLTAIFEMLILALSFQLLKGTSFRTVNRTMITFFAATSVCLVVYMALLSLFVYEEPVSGKYFVKGFACTQEATEVFPSKCPFFTDENLRDAEWEAGRLWYPWSIAVVKVSLVIFWIAMFISIAAAIGSFLVYQGGMRTRHTK